VQRAARLHTYSDLLICFLYGGRLNVFSSVSCAHLQTTTRLSGLGLELGPSVRPPLILSNAIWLLRMPVSALGVLLPIRILADNDMFEYLKGFPDQPRQVSATVV
jgi:hypothetical protein